MDRYAGLDYMPVKPLSHLIPTDYVRKRIFSDFCYLDSMWKQVYNKLSKKHKYKKVIFYYIKRQTKIWNPHFCQKYSYTSRWFKMWIEMTLAHVCLEMHSILHVDNDRWEIVFFFSKDSKISLMGERNGMLDCPRALFWTVGCQILIGLDASVLIYALLLYNKSMQNLQYSCLWYSCL